MRREFFPCARAGTDNAPPLQLSCCAACLQLEALGSMTPTKIRDVCDWGHHEPSHAVGVALPVRHSRHHYRYTGTVRALGCVMHRAMTESRCLPRSVLPSVATIFLVVKRGEAV